MKKRLTILLALILMAGTTLSLAACGSEDKEPENEPEKAEETLEEIEEEVEEIIEEEPEEPEEEEPEEAPEPVTEIESDGTILPDGVQQAFDLAMEKMTEIELKPVAFVSEQVVAGMNYMILCERTGEVSEWESDYVMLIVYQDTDGRAMVMTMKDFHISSLIDTDNPVQGEGLAGGWYVPEDHTVADLEDWIEESFLKAAGDQGLVPMAYLDHGAEGDYTFLCTKKGDESHLYLVIIRGEGDDAVVTQSCVVDPGVFNE